VSEAPIRPWYHGVTRYQWLVLAIACVGWVFDVFEGQLFNLTRGQMLPELLGVPATDPAVKQFGDRTIGVFLLGGTVGGMLFGVLADRIGRRPAMILTILMYSVFSGLTCLATTWPQVAVLRFLVAMGVGGEWAVAAALVAEVFPPHARVHASGFFHATSVLGTWLATLAGMAVGTNWRLAYLIGVAPALLTLWVRASLRESEVWQTKKADRKAAPGGSVRELLGDARWARRAWLGMGLAAVGLASFWSVTIAAQDLADLHLRNVEFPRFRIIENSKFAYGVVSTTGTGLGLLAFAPLAVRFGRRRTFALYHLGALIIVPMTCLLPTNYLQLLLLLPLFGFFTVGMHAGYAVYFPELFPTRLRATGSSFCFNVGRLVAAPMLFLSGALKARTDLDLRVTISLLGLLFALGFVFLLALPETKDEALPA